MQAKNPILIIGMARSGTTLVSHILGSLDNVHPEIEPHALWRTGNFKYFNDEDFDIKENIVKRIREKLSETLNGKILLEKSPINSLRPSLVHAVFPDAKIIYIQRDAVRCIYSNYVRSIKKDSFKLSIIVKKYFFYTGSKDLSGAISSRKLHQQLSLSDIPGFLFFTTKMFYLRAFSVLPFGPKIRNFENITKQKGLLGYHVEVFKKSMDYKKEFQKIYGDNMQVFDMEKIMLDKNEIERLVNFAGLDYKETWGNEIQKTLDAERIKDSTKEHKEDEEIRRLLAQ